jgi:hypothetical protein
MKNTYTVKYLPPGCWKWRKHNNVIGDGLDAGFRFLLTDDDKIIHFPLDSEVIFPPERQRIIEKKMSKEAGIPVMRN